MAVVTRIRMGTLGGVALALLGTSACAQETGRPLTVDSSALSRSTNSGTSLAPSDPGARPYCPPPVQLAVNPREASNIQFEEPTLLAVPRYLKIAGSFFANARIPSARLSFVAGDTSRKDCTYIPIIGTGQDELFADKWRFHGCVQTFPQPSENGATRRDNGEPLAAISVSLQLAPGTVGRPGFAASAVLPVIRDAGNVAVDPQKPGFRFSTPISLYPVPVSIRPAEWQVIYQRDGKSVAKRVGVGEGEKARGPRHEVFTETDQISFYRARKQGVLLPGVPLPDVLKLYTGICTPLPTICSGDGPCPAK